eukprot:7965762-Pyramimonas_sp.AAC.1
MATGLNAGDSPNQAFLQPQPPAHAPSLSRVFHAPHRHAQHSSNTATHMYHFVRDPGGPDAAAGVPPGKSMPKKSQL